MRMLLRCVVAGLWGIPGPVFAMVLVVVYFSESPYPWNLGSVANNLIRCWPLILLEACGGAFYGVLRSIAVHFDGFPNGRVVRAGVIQASVVWALAGAPFLIVIGLAVLIGSVASGNTPPMQLLLGMLRFLGIYAAHIVGGAIAGFHVEYFLLHWGRVRGGNGGQPFTE